MDNSTKGGVGSGGQNPQLQLPLVTEFGLESGLGGVFIDAPNSQSMLLEISFRAGRYLCPKDKPEISHFLEHLVIGANRDYPSQAEFSRAVLAKGAYSNAFTGIYNIRYVFLAPDFDWQRILGLMLTSVSQPLFLPDEFESERKVIHQEHKLRLDDHSRVIGRLTNKQTGFLSVTHEECLACLGSIDIDDLKDYHNQTHTLSNARLVIAGYLPQGRQDLIKQKLSGLSLPVGDGRSPMPPEELKGVGLVYMENASVETVHYRLLLVRKGLALEPQDEIALSLLINLWFKGHNSRIFGQARTQGLVYSIGGGFNSTTTSSCFTFAGQVSPDKFESLLDLVLAEIDRLLAGDLSDEEIDRGKDYLRGQFQLRSFTPESWADYCRTHYLDRELLLPVDYPPRLESVGKGRVVDLARQIFTAGDWTLGLLGNIPEDVRQRLETKLNQRKAR